MEGFNFIIQLMIICFPYAFFGLAVKAVFTGVQFLGYRKSDYGSVSGNGFFKTVWNIGNYGEYLTFRVLEQLQIEKKLLTNVYIPKADGSTTEIDLLMICQWGVFVFESKNYSGWIFGDDRSQYWTQSLKGRRKYRFYNPIWQNAGHITALSNYLSEVDQGKFYSYIVFSERCELKKIKTSSTSVKLLKRDDLKSALQKQLKGTSESLQVSDVEMIYSKLQPLTLADQSIKDAHIESITNFKSNKKMTLREPSAIQHDMAIVPDDSNDSLEMAEIPMVSVEPLFDVEMGSVEAVGTEAAPEPIGISVDATKAAEYTEKLKAYRLQVSRRDNVKPYLVFNNSQMEDLILKVPKNRTELMSVNGFSSVKVEKYGDEILEIMGKF